MRLFGQPIACGSPELDTIKSRIGVVLDTCALPRHLPRGRCGRYRAGSLPRMGRRPIRRAVRSLQPGPKKKVSELSRGMGIKLTLAFALSHNPELLVLDEATAGLDPIARDEVLDLLRDFMAEGDRGILMSTHITSDLEKIADEVVCVDAGRIVFTAPKGCHHRRGRRGPLPRRRRDRHLGCRLLRPGEAASCATTTAATCSPPTASPSPAPSPDIPVDKATIRRLHDPHSERGIPMKAMIVSDFAVLRAPFCNYWVSAPSSPCSWDMSWAQWAQRLPLPPWFPSWVCSASLPTTSRTTGSAFVSRCPSLAVR